MFRNFTAALPSLAQAELRVGRLQYAAVHQTFLRTTGAKLAEATALGLRVPYLRCGRGEPVVLVHGFGDRKETWAAVTLLLSRNFDVIALDLPGFGEAPTVDSGLITPRAQAKFLAAFLDALGLPRVHLVGQSMGGGIAARFAVDFPERLRSVSLLSPAGPEGLHPDIQARVDQGRNPLLAKDFADFEVLNSILFAKKPLMPRPMRRAVAERWCLRVGELRGHFARLAAPEADDGAWCEGQTQVPTLLLYGRQERLVSLDNHRFYEARMPRARSVWLDAVGHLPHLEAPWAVVKALRITFAQG